MPSIKIINDQSDIKLSNKWCPAAKFNCKDKIVNSKGREYQIIEKYERAFSTCEKVKRVFLWILVICSLGLALISKSVLDLLRKKNKTIRFALPAPIQNPLVNNAPVPKQKEELFTAEELEQSRHELERGIDIPEEAIEKIKASFGDICCNFSEKIQFAGSNENERVFSLEEFPNLIFKMHRHQTFANDAKIMKERYHNMVLAQAVIRKNYLDLLVVPNAKLFTIEIDGKNYDIIAQRRMDINPQENIYEQVYGNLASSLNDTIPQLALFICKTGYDTVSWSKIPIPCRQCAPRKIALIDIKTMRSIEHGLFGTPWEDPKSIGLVRCVTEEQGKIVERVAKEHGINTQRFQEAHEQRKKAIEENNRLYEFYVNKDIQGNDPVTIDESLLKFPEEEEKLKNLVKNLVEKINFKISKGSLEESTKGLRTVEIDLCSLRPDYKTEHKELVGTRDTMSYLTDEEYYDATYLGQAVEKLIEIGAIYKIIHRSGERYILQA